MRFTWEDVQEYWEEVCDDREIAGEGRGSEDSQNIATERPLTEKVKEFIRRELCRLDEYLSENAYSTMYGTIADACDAYERINAEQ